jgi:hypothetical protein
VWPCTRCPVSALSSAGNDRGMFSAWLARRRWLRDRVSDRLAAEAAFFLDHLEPVDLGHWRTVVVGKKTGQN